MFQWRVKKYYKNSWKSNIVYYSLFIKLKTGTFLNQWSLEQMVTYLSLRYFFRMLITILQLIICIKRYITKPYDFVL